MSGGAGMTEKILMNEFQKLAKEPWTNIELVDENILHWSVALIILNTDSPYHGGYYKANMTFPSNYPYSPPDFKFTRPLYHPNIYPDGRLCISILHPPGDDEMSGELASERWTPAQRVESVLISIISLFDDPEVSSPANVDAGVLYRKDRASFVKRVAQDKEASKADIPDGYELPTQETVWKAAKDREAAHGEPEIDWADSGDEDDFDEDFGGSDSDGDEDVEFGDENDEESDGESGAEEEAPSSSAATATKTEAKPKKTATGKDDGQVAEGSREDHDAEMTDVDGYVEDSGSDAEADPDL